MNAIIITLSVIFVVLIVLVILSNMDIIDDDFCDLFIGLMFISFLLLVFCMIGKVHSRKQNELIIQKLMNDQDQISWTLENVDDFDSALFTEMYLGVREYNNKVTELRFKASRFIGKDLIPVTYKQLNLIDLNKLPRSYLLKVEVRN